VGARRTHSRRGHRGGGDNAPDETAAVTAHPSSGSTCEGGAEAARRCPTMAEALRSRVARVVGSCSTGGERRLRATTHGGPAYRGGGDSMSGVAHSSGGKAVLRLGNDVDRLSGGAGRRRHAEWMEKKNGEKGGEVGGQWILFSGLVAWAGRKKGGMGVRGAAPRGGENGVERGGRGSVTWTGMTRTRRLRAASTTADDARLAGAAGAAAIGEGGGVRATRAAYRWGRTTPRLNGSGWV
jgi:hypothetical protein